MEIRKRIYETICWFDLFDRPLLGMEVYKYLFKNDSDLKNVRKNLRKMIGTDLSRKGNLYCLKGREEIFDIFKKRQVFSKKKWRRAKFVGMLLRKVPFVRGVAVSQSLAIDNAKEKSDIDLFIITAKNKLWTSRALVNLMLDTFRLRSLKSKAPICPSFLIVRDSLDLGGAALKPKDIYLAYWVASLRPLFGKEIFKEFLRENKWIRQYFLKVKELDNSPIKLNWFLFIAQKMLEVIFWPLSLFENRLRELQIKKIKKYARKTKNQMLELDKEMAKIHYNDKRSFYLEEWQRKIKGYS